MDFVLPERLAPMERQWLTNVQYSECLELVGVPPSVSDGYLEEKVLKL